MSDNLGSNNGVSALSEMVFKKLTIDDLIVNGDTNLKNFDLPSYTNDERNALTPNEGFMIYNSTYDRINFYKSGEWESFEEEYIYVADYVDKNVGTSITSGVEIQFAVNKAISERKPLVFPPGEKEFRSNIAITIDLDWNSPYFVCYGNNAVLYPDGDFPFFKINPLCPKAEIGTGREVAYFEIRDLKFDGFYESAHTNTRAIQIGQTGFALSPFLASRANKCICVLVLQRNTLFI